MLPSTISDATDIIKVNFLPYNYVPSHSTAVVFLVLFSLSTALHVGQAVYYRQLWLYPTIVVAGILEILGWSARLWSSHSPTLLIPFEMQISCTILAPTPLVAANFIALGYIIKRLGPSYSRLQPKMYTIVFCACDVISLVVQAIGGGRASVAVSMHQNPTPGAHIMLGGIVFQMVTITIYVFCAGEFFFRYLKNKPIGQREKQPGDVGQDRPNMELKLEIMVVALMFSTICLFIRAVYRTIELSDGWTGRIIATQVLFNVLDGAMVTLAIFTLNFCHPGYLLDLRHPRTELPSTLSQESNVDKA